MYLKKCSFINENFSSTFNNTCLKLKVFTLRNSYVQYNSTGNTCPLNTTWMVVQGIGYYDPALNLQITRPPHSGFPSGSLPFHLQIDRETSPKSSTHPGVDCHNLHPHSAHFYTCCSYCLEDCFQIFTRISASMSPPQQGLPGPPN